MSLIDGPVVKRIVRNLILPNADDYRVEVVHLIDEEFLRFALSFFQEVCNAKMENTSITLDWYRKAFIDDASMKKDDIALNAGVNMKTISNIRGSQSRTVVIDAAQEHYDGLKTLIKELISENEEEINFSIAIKIGKVSVELTINESLIVINALAVKRAAIRGGAWSTAGKRTEKLLMRTLCELHSVGSEHWNIVPKKTKKKDPDEREVDFYLRGSKGTHKCEVKLMGKGNPESADAVVARGSRVFVADTLLPNTKKQLKHRKVLWVALKERGGYRRFSSVLDDLGIPNTPPQSEVGLESRIEEILRQHAD